MAAARTLTRDNQHVYLTLASTGGVWECPIDFESEALAEGWVFAAGPAGAQVGSPPLTKAQADSLYDPLGTNLTLLDLDSKTAQVVTPGSITGDVLAKMFATPQAALAPAIPRQRPPKGTVWTAFQSGHGWTSAGQGTINLNDTSDFLAGGQCVSIVTNGASADGWVQQFNGTARDLTNQDVTIWVKVVAGLDNLNKISVFASSDNLVNYWNGSVYDGTWPAAPVRQMRQGEWFPLRFNFESLPNVTGSPVKTAVSGMRIAVSDKGGGTPVTVRIGRVQVAPRTTAYPNGMISFTFDDSLLTTYSVAAPYLARYAFPATEYAIADLSEQGTSSMSIAQLHELQDKWGWEVAAHAYKIANHDIGFSNMSGPDLDAELRNLKAWLLANGFTGADHLAYPRGWHSATTDPYVGRYFATARTLYSKPQETYRPAVPLRMRSYGTGPGTTLAQVQAEVDRCVANQTWLNFCIHGVTASPSGSEMSTTVFQGMVDYVAGKSSEVMTIGDAWRALA